MRNHVTHVLRVDCVEDGVEVGPVRVAILRVLVLQVLHHFTVAKELGENVLYAELVILRHIDGLAFRYRQQRFLALEHLAHEIAVDGRERRYIKLDYTTAVRMCGSYLRCSLM